MSSRRAFSAAALEGLENSTTSSVPSGVAFTISHSLFSGLKFQEKFVGIPPAEIIDLVPGPPQGRVSLLFLVIIVFLSELAILPSEIVNLLFRFFFCVVI